MLETSNYSIAKGSNSMNIYYVYAYLRKKDLTPYYIGKGKGYRAYNKEHTVTVPKDHNKIVFYHTCLTEKDANSLEIKYIKLFGRKDLGTGILRNRTNGGEGTTGPKTPVHLAKISKALKGKKQPNISKAKKGIVLSIEHKEALSKSKKGKKQPNVSLAKKGISLGPRSSDVKVKIAKTLTGKLRGHWFNDGQKSYLKLTCPEGCVPGRLKY